ncbi:MAG: ATP-binding protein [Myxococcota bacterium]
MSDPSSLHDALHRLIALDFDVELGQQCWTPEWATFAQEIETLAHVLKQSVVPADHVSALFLATPIPLLQLTHDLEVTASNAAALPLFGHAVEGLPLTDVLRDLWADSEAPLPTTAQLLTGVRCEVLGMGGNAIIADLKLAPLHGRFQELEGYVLSASDVTEDVSARSHAERLQHRAEEESAARTRFLATISHELRTPLNGIIGMSELLNSNDATQREEATRVIVACSEQLAGLVSNFLDFTHLSLEASSLSRERVNLGLLLTDAVTAARSQASRGVDVRLTLADGFEPEVYADPVRIRQVIDNLLHNALKYTSHGHIEVHAHTRLAPSGVHVQLSVSDTGIGIPAEHVSTIFDPYERRSTGAGGAGLGLSIVRTLVQRMNGAISVKSTPGQGSTFTVNLRLDPLPEEGRSQLGAHPDVHPLHLTVLVVDDNPVNRLVVRRMLESMNCEVIEACDGLECVEIMKRHRSRIDAVLMDCEMPRMDGPAACAELRRLHIATPVVALTAHAMESHQKRCEDVGMVSFLTKPVQRHHLYQALAPLDVVRDHP